MYLAPVRNDWCDRQLHTYGTAAAAALPRSAALLLLLLLLLAGAPHPCFDPLELVTSSAQLHLY
jgi:hypothetical protein